MRRRRVGVELKQLAAVRQSLANIPPEELASANQRLGAGEVGGVVGSEYEEGL